MAAFPLPPSIAHWDGLILAPRGVYETHINFGDLSGDADANRTLVSMTDLPSPATQQIPGRPIRRKHRSFRRSNTAIIPMLRRIVHRDRKASPASRNIFLVRAISRLRAFTRKDQIRFVEYYDARFPHRDRGPSPFTYQVRFDANGAVLSQGWKK